MNTENEIFTFFSNLKYKFMKWCMCVCMHVCVCMCVHASKNISLELGGNQEVFQ